MNNEFRRGTVLGLTIAEIFILLIFLVLLAFLGLANNWEKKEKEYLAGQQLLSEWRDVIEEFEAPEEIRTLYSKAKRLEQQLDGKEAADAEKRLAALSRESVELREEVEAMRREREKLRDENTKLSQENSALQEERNSLREDSAAAKRNADQEMAALREEIETIRKQRDESIRDNGKLSNMYAALREERDALHEQLANAEQQTARIRAEFDTFRRKGQNPPCWYETVAAGDGTREKAHYLFNIAVHDEYMVVRRRPIPSGQADDDRDRPSRSYAEEAADLGLENIPFGTPLDDEEMNRHMKPIRDLGKDRGVRSYSCIFSVKVWDRTSPDAKLRWKQAHDGILEGLFGTYIVKDDPWPESN